MSQAQTGNSYLNQSSQTRVSQDGIYHYHSLLGSFMLSIESICVLQLNIVAVHSYQPCLSCVELVHKQIVSARFSSCFLPCKSCQLYEIQTLKEMGKKNVRKNWGKKSLWKKKMYFPADLLPVPLSQKPWEWQGSMSCMQEPKPSFGSTSAGE